jgi:hypothetical protein
LLALALAGCGQNLDPTQIFNPPTPLDHGVNLTVYFAGDSGNKPVMHVWVEHAGANIRTLLTTNGGATYSCPGPNFCPCEGSGAYAYWRLFCQANQATNGDASFLTDANSSATQSYPFSMPLYFGWDWRDRNGAVVAGDTLTAQTYTLRAEVSGYYYGGVAGEAWVNITKNGAGGSDQGTVDSTGRWLEIDSDWKP